MCVNVNAYIIPPHTHAHMYSLNLWWNSLSQDYSSSAVFSQPTLDAPLSHTIPQILSFAYSCQYFPSVFFIQFDRHWSIHSVLLWDPLLCVHWPDNMTSPVLFTEVYDICFQPYPVTVIFILTNRRALQNV